MFRINLRYEAVLFVLILGGTQLALFVLPVDSREAPPPCAVLFYNPTAAEIEEYGQPYVLAGSAMPDEFETLDAWSGSVPEPVVSGGGWKKGSLAPWGGFWPPTTTYLGVDIKTPNGLSGSGEFYYVLLSCVDSAGSYDQIGFSACYGHWGLTWCWTTHDWLGNPTYHYDASAVTLAKNTYYRFEMTLSGGYLTYQLVVGGWVDWQKTVYTGGSYFYLTNVVQVGIYSYHCFTNYEEVYYTDAQTPDFDFKFQNTQTATDYWDSWDIYSVDAPAGIGVTISTSQHYVYVTNPDAP